MGEAIRRATQAQGTSTTSRDEPLAPPSSRLEAARLTSPILVGRDEELARLVDLVRSPPGVAIIAGEAGVGKTRVVNELLRHPDVKGGLWLVGSCRRLREPFPLGPVVEALRQLSDGPRLRRDLNPVAGALHGLLPELKAVLPSELTRLHDRRAEVHRVFRGLRELLGAVGPAVLLLEDLHWGDELTLGFVNYLQEEMPSDLTVVVTLRPEEASARLVDFDREARSALSSVHLSLDPLSPEHVRDLTAGVLGTDEVSGEFAHYLHERTSGLPFACEEVLRLLQDRSDLVHHRGKWVRRALAELRVPPSLRESIGERVATLPVEARRILEAAAVVGEPSRKELLGKVAGVQARVASRALSHALRSDLLTHIGDGRYAFRHVLVKEAIYDSLLEVDRHDLHARAAQALRHVTPQPLAQLAYHSRKADPSGRWWRYAERAADRASGLGDDVTASHFLRDAVSTAALPKSARARMAVKLSSAAINSLEHKDAVAAVRRVLEEEDLPAGVRGEVRFSLGRLLAQGGQIAEASSEMATAVDELRRRPGLAALAMTYLAWPTLTDGVLEEKLTWLERATSTVRLQGDSATKIAVLSDRASILLSSGDPGALDAMDEILWDANSPQERDQLLRACTNLAVYSFWLGDYSRTGRFIDKGMQMAQESNSARLVPFLRAHRLLLEWTAGRWGELEETAQQLRVVTAEFPAALIETELVSGLVFLAQGRLRDSSRFLESALDLATADGAREERGMAAGGLVRLFLAEGRIDEACDLALDVFGEARAKGILSWMVTVFGATIEALVANGEIEQADKSVDEFRRMARGSHVPIASALVLTARGAIAHRQRDFERGARLYAGAARAWGDLPQPYESARAHERQGECLLEINGPKGADLVTRALWSFHDLGASWDVARCRHVLSRHGVEPPRTWRAGRKGYGPQLSPREQEVVRLVVAGHSNREIAQALFVAPSTVGNQVQSAMRKLGVSSRTALAVAAADLDDAQSGGPEPPVVTIPDSATVS